MKKEFIFTCLLIAAATQLFPQPSTTIPTERKITLIWTANEKGRHVGSAAAYATVIKKVRSQTPSALLLSLGNFMGPTPATIISQGQIDFQIREKLGYDLLRLSHHEFIVGESELSRRIAETKVAVLSGNLEIPDSPAKKWMVSNTRDGRIGFLSLTGSQFPLQVAKNVRPRTVLNPFSDYASEAVEEMKGQADIIVALSDLRDEELEEARRIPGIDVIISEGDFTGKERSEWISMAFQGARRASLVRTMTTQPGVYRIVIHCAWGGTPERWVVRDIEGDFFDVSDSAAADPEMDTWVNERIETLRLNKAQVLGTLEGPVANDDVRSGQSELGILAADMIRNLTRTHLAVLNAGMFRAGLPAGEVTEWHLLEAMPYPDYIVVKRLTGSQLEKILDKADELSGQGGYLQWSGLETDPPRLGNRVAGVAISSDRTYTVALNDFLAQGGDGYDEFREATTLWETGLTLQDLCRKRFREKGTLIDPDMAMDNEWNFWFGKISLSGTANSIIAPEENEIRYPQQSSLSGEQSLCLSAEARLELNRKNFYFGLENHVEAAIGASWDKDWLTRIDRDQLGAGAQFTLFASNFIFDGAIDLDPYLSVNFETVMVFPDPDDYEETGPRPGTLKLSGGLELEFLEYFSFKFGFRWQDNPFDEAQAPDTGLEALLDFEWEPISSTLSVHSETDAFSSFDFANDGINILSENSIELHLLEHIKTGPKLTLFYNTREGFLAYILVLTLTTEFRF